MRAISNCLCIYGAGGQAGGVEAVVEAVEPVRLKQWPGKDALQALAAWWMAATLCEDHRYTEPDLTLTLTLSLTLLLTIGYVQTVSAGTVSGAQWCI